MSNRHKITGKLDKDSDDYEKIEANLKRKSRLSKEKLIKNKLTKENNYEINPD